MVEPTYLEKCARQIRKSSPRIGMKIKKYWSCHHLVSVLNWSFRKRLREVPNLPFLHARHLDRGERSAHQCTWWHVGFKPGGWNEASEVKKKKLKIGHFAPKGNESSSNHPMLVSGSAYHLKYVFFAKMLRGISPYNSAVVEWPLLMIFRTLGNYPPENSQREPKNVRFGEWFSSSKTWFSGSTLLSWGLKRQNLPQVAFCQPTMADFGVWDFPVHPNSSNVHVHTTPVFPGQKWHRKFFGVLHVLTIRALESLETFSQM